ncbi:hypothetical protein BRADI_4g33190v3 [Brachypodium distachyon]|uniref:25S rRNA (uridine-N(3))-methyltransferase BMT5-like domain-containing protein n=1 Tax=Brachypodium distachyon TaxID=15368 RepID=A0A0Q3PML6_BRADI|nr:hypothetical protein BRADI_4g33190v3 [Brachypodium distachyon]
MQSITVAANDEAAGAKWLKHYSSAQSILVVGDGDFSFSLSLATAFGSGDNLVATSLDTYADLGIKYGNALSNVSELERMGATVMHGVDVTQMDPPRDLLLRLFDRIVFNLPHAGFNGREDNKVMISLHQELVRGFFRWARGRIWPDGEIHVTHKTKHPYWIWDIEKLASDSSLALIDKVPFDKKDYPGYNQKRGDGWRCDQDFPIEDCCTFKFGVQQKSATIDFSSFFYTGL